MEQQAPRRLGRGPRRGSAGDDREAPPLPPPPPLLGRISLFGPKNFAGKSAEVPMLSKAEFVEKVRQSNQACQDGDFHKAVALYSETLGVDPQNCILYSNRSAAYMKTQQYDRALEDAIKARLLNPKWPKSLTLFREGRWGASVLLSLSAAAAAPAFLLSSKAEGGFQAPFHHGKGGRSARISALVLMRLARPVRLGDVHSN